MSLHVGNLSRHVQKTDLESVFGRFGTCQVYMKEGYAFAKFLDFGNAERALQELVGKPLFNGHPSISWSKNQPGQPRRYANGDHVRGNIGPWPGVQFPSQAQAQTQAQAQAQAQVQGQAQAQEQAQASGFVADASRTDDAEKGGKAVHDQGSWQSAMADGDEFQSVWDRADLEERVDLELEDEELDVVFMDKANNLHRHQPQQEKSGTGAGEVTTGICSPANGLVQLQSSSTPGTSKNDALTNAEKWRGPSVPPAADGERRGQDFGGREPGVGQPRRTRWSPSRPGWRECSHCGKPGHTVKYCRLLGNGPLHFNAERQNWGNNRSYVPRGDLRDDRRDSKGGHKERENEQSWEKGNDRDKDAIGDDWRHRRQREEELVSNGERKRRSEEGEITDHCTSVSRSNKSRRSPSPVESKSSGSHPRRDFRRGGGRSRDSSSSSEAYRMQGSNKRSLTRIPSSASRSQTKTYSARQSEQESPPWKRVKASTSRSSSESESRSLGRSPPTSDCHRTVSPPSKGTHSRSYSPASISLAGSRSGSHTSRSGSSDQHAASMHLICEVMSRKDAEVENGRPDVQACKRMDREGTKLAIQPVTPSSGMVVERGPVVDRPKISHKGAEGRERRTVDEKSRYFRNTGRRHEDVVLKKDHGNNDDMAGKEENIPRMRAYDTMNCREKPSRGASWNEELENAAGDRELSGRSSKEPESLEVVYGNCQLYSSPDRCAAFTLGEHLKVQTKSSEEMVDQWLESPRTHDTSGAPHNPSVIEHQKNEQGLAEVYNQSRVLPLKFPGDVAESYGAARCWPQEAVVYRRVSKGPISIENYKRRATQNAVFGIEDLFVRSSSSWWERDSEGNLLEPDRI